MRHGQNKCSVLDVQKLTIISSTPETRSIKIPETNTFELSQCQCPDGYDVFNWKPALKAEILSNVRTYLKPAFGKILTMAPLKGEERIIQKIEEEHKREDTLFDYIRGTISIKKIENLPKVFEKLWKLSNTNPNFTILRIKNGFKGFLEGRPGPEDYPRIVLNVMILKSIIIEIQIVLEFVKSLSKIDHMIYEIARQKNAHMPTWKF